MKKYDSYKDSGIEWIGEIPSHWNTGKSKQGFTRNKEKAFQEDPIILSLTSRGVVIRDISNNEGQIAESYYEYNLVEPGDLLLNPMDLITNAFSFVSNYEGVISPAYFNLKQKSGFESNYFKYYYQLQYWNLSFFHHGKGVSIEHRWTLNEETFKHFPIPIPPQPEQTAIAAYLDRKTAGIDELITDKKRLLELYDEEKTAIINQAVTKGINPDVPMKDSGIEWLGKIPKNWEVKRLKYVLKINSGDGIKSEEIKPHSTYPVYGGNGIVGYTENYNSDSIEIIIGRVGAKCGNVRLVNGAKWISDNALVATLISNIDIHFLSIQMQNMDLNKMANQNAQPLITGTMVKEKEAIFPPLEEQQSIVSHIETECARIDAKKAKTEKLIELLTEYRTALISEVVTGKIKVTESF